MAAPLSRSALVQRSAVLLSLSPANTAGHTEDSNLQFLRAPSVLTARSVSASDVPEDEEGRVASGGALSQHEQRAEHGADQQLLPLLRPEHGSGVHCQLAAHFFCADARWKPSARAVPTAERWVRVVREALAELARLVLGVVSAVNSAHPACYGPQSNCRPRTSS